MRRIPNLDGLRALSIAVVFLFHARVPGFGGGFLGVSLFFTLSGYLLGLQLAADPGQRRPLGRYWVGRARRLLPLAWLVMGVVLLVEGLAGTVPRDAERRLWTTLLGLANWHQLIGGGSYSDLFTAPDALVHYWSLAIEQQVYVLLPLVLLALRRIGPRRRQFAVLAGLATASFLAPVVFGLSASRTYYGTDTRAGEILVGVMLAVWHLDHPRARSPRRGDLLAGSALVGMAVLVLAARPGGGFVAAGLLPAQAFLSVTLVHVAATVPGLWRGVLERRPVVRVGHLSYAVYLVHWPVLVLVGAAGWARPVAVGVAAALSWAAAVLVVRWVERPVRSARDDLSLAGGLAAGALTVITVSAVFPAATTLGVLDDIERDGGALHATLIEGDRIERARPISTTTLPVRTTTTAPAGPALSTTTTVPSPEPVRATVFGDSVALTFALALHAYPVDGLVQVDLATMMGCGVMPVRDGDQCAAAMPGWDASLARTRPDLALVVSCQWELIERELPDGSMAHIGEPGFDGVLSAAIRAAIQRLLDGGSRHVAWASCPELALTTGFAEQPDLLKDSRDPARVTRFNEVLASVVAEYGDRAEVIDLHAWMTGRTDDAAIRADGSHFVYEHETEFTRALGEILAPAVAATRQARQQ